MICKMFQYTFLSDMLENLYREYARSCKGVGWALQKLASYKNKPRKSQWSSQLFVKKE